MKRTNIYLSDFQIERVARLNELIDSSLADIVRRALDDYLSAKEREFGISTITENKKPPIKK